MKGKALLLRHGDKSDAVAPMNVALIIPEMNVRGGTHKQVQRLAEYLVRQGHKATIHTYCYDVDCCYPGIAALDVIAATSETNLLSPQPGFLSKMRRFLEWIARSWKLFLTISPSSKIANFHDCGCELVMLLLRLVRPQVRIVWQINDLPVCFHVGSSKMVPKGQLDWLRRRFYRIAARCASQITVNVTKNKDRVQTYLGLDAVVLHCGVDVRNVAPRSLPGANKPNIEMVSTGVFFPYRNYETVLNVQAVLKQRHGLTSRLRIVGATHLDQAYTNRIDHLIRETGANAAIMGTLTETELDALYLETDYFLFLNIDQSWGLAVFEAMNYAIPVFVANSVGAVELLHDGVDAIVVNPFDYNGIADHIAELQRDSTQYQIIAANAFTATKKMTWDAMYCEPMHHIFLGLISCKP